MTDAEIRSRLDRALKAGVTTEERYLIEVVQGWGGAIPVTTKQRLEAMFSRISLDDAPDQPGGGDER